MKALRLIVMVIFVSSMAIGAMAQDHLLITELCVRPNNPSAEFVEIYNGTGATVDLSMYYLTDATYKNDNDYVNIVDGTFTPFSYDFLAKFPDGATIEDGQYIVVAVKGEDFNTVYGMYPDFELVATSDSVADMEAPGTDFIASNTSLTDGGESVQLFHWDGQSDLIHDVDMVVWGDKDEAVDKTGVKKDGPDADSDSTMYLPDTPVANQIPITDGKPHLTDGNTAQRKALAEVNETTSGGNGITGHDETSEDLASAFIEAPATPGSGYVSLVKVTFVANTATVPDTLGPNSTVQIRGSGGPLTWGGDSPVIMENVGGDYWKVTVEFEAGTAVEFKFYTNAHDSVWSGSDWEHQGWEGDVATGNRRLTVGTADTTLPLQFVNGWQQGVDQYATPWETQDSTFVVWVRVNMQGWEDFNPAAQQIGLRGSNNVDWGQTGELSWGSTYLLQQESNHVNGGSQQYAGRFFYSGAIHVPVQYAGTGLEFKVVVHNAGAPLDEDWSNMIYNPNLQTHMDISGADTTNHWFWFDNLKPRVVEHADTVVVTWIADMKNALNSRGFSYGDTVEVRSGYFGTAAAVRSKPMRRMGLSTRYTATDTILTTVGEQLDYQFYLIKNGVEYREVYYNFAYDGENLGEAERRIFSEITGNEITIEDINDSKSDPHRMPLFRNTSLLTQNVTVTYTCDVRPAVYQVMAGDTLQDIQGNVDITSPDQVIDLGVIINGPATGGWGTWGPGLLQEETHLMYDDGTHGDVVAGDSIYSIQFMYSPDSGDVVGQEFKFGIGGGDNEGGYGNNHIENIDDTNSEFTIASQFGSIDPLFYNAWNFDTQNPTEVHRMDETVTAARFELDQNYPNPFNPTTNIKYSLPEHGMITLKVFNLMGQEVKVLVNKQQAAGRYVVEWDGTDNMGKPVSSGLYIYRIEAGDHIKSRKMMLMK